MLSTVRRRRRTYRLKLVLYIFVQIPYIGLASSTILMAKQRSNEYPKTAKNDHLMSHIHSNVKMNLF